MNVVVLTSIRVLGDGLAGCLNNRPPFNAVAVVDDLGKLRSALAKVEAHVVLIDVSPRVDLTDVRALAVEWPHIPFVALGLTEDLQEVIKCGRAGFAGYVAREATIDGLCASLTDVVEGRVSCPPEIACGLLRALFRAAPNSEDSSAGPSLTRRESEVLDLIGRGFSNKEIGSELCLSVATVKHHVHHVLEKLGLPSRTDAFRRLRESPWLGRTTAVTSGKQAKVCGPKNGRVS
jgi:DNA-binding NarL/FixJ family response regulator